MKTIILSAILSVVCSTTVSAQTQLRPDNIDQVISELTLKEKVRLVLGCRMQMGQDAKFPGTAGSTYAIPRLGIPAIYCADSQQGLRMAEKRPWDHRDYITTDFPATMTIASTWDRQAAFRVGQGIGNEVREFGLDWILAPSMNLMRSPLCGRNHEYYSEDPYLSGMMAAGYVNGVQSEGTAAAPKHFVANNQEANRASNDSRMSQRALREIYLRAFEIMIKESNPWTIMTSYNHLNGPFTCENRDLLTTIVRDEWGWDGMFVTDWNAGHDAVQSMIAGQEMLQPGQERQYKAIYEAAKSDRLPMTTLDRNVKRLAQAYHAVGKKVVVLLDICSPIEVASWQDDVDAVLCTWQGGQEMGFSVADVLSGKVNPSGKLPMTFQLKYGDAYVDRNFPADVDQETLDNMFMWGYRPEMAPKDRKLVKDLDYTDYEEDIYVGYRYFDSFGKPVAYPFGYGLSYTTFGYSNMTVSRQGDVYTVSVDVENTGSRAGRNVVELFVAAPNSRKANKPEKELRAFTKTRLLQPREKETVTMKVTTAQLASFNIKKSAWITDPGTYRFLICSSASKVEAEAKAKVGKYQQKVHNVLRPQVKLNLLKRK